MKLNLDCVRSVLLCVEEHTDLRTMCVFVDTGLDAAMRMIGEPANILDYQQELLADFDNDELIYHVNYCVEAGLLK